MIPDHETNSSSSDVLHNDSSFARFMRNGEIKQGSITQHLSKDLEDATKEHLDLIYTQNEEMYFNHNMEHLSWYNIDEISIQCLRALPNRDGVLKNDVFIEAFCCILGYQVTFFNLLRMDTTSSDAMQQWSTHMVLW